MNFLALGGVYTFNVPEVFPETVFGYEFFNFFFALPLIFAVLVVVPLAILKILNRS